MLSCFEQLPPDAFLRASAFTRCLSSRFGCHHMPFFTLLLPPDIFHHASALARCLSTRLFFSSAKPYVIFSRLPTAQHCCHICEDNIIDVDADYTCTYIMCNGQHLYNKIKLANAQYLLLFIKLLIKLCLLQRQAKLDVSTYKKSYASFIDLRFQSKI